MLREYQTQLKTAIYDAWQSGAQNVGAVLPTGAGKTVVMADIIRESQGRALAIDHRTELVSQLSLALAREGVMHDLIASKTTVRTIISLHCSEFGHSFYSPGARCIIAGIDTLVRASPSRVGNIDLLIQDEAHHVLRENKWGRAAQMFPNARGLYLTATPTRADGRGLGRHADGVVDVLIEGATTASLIEQGWLCRYRIFAPANAIDVHDVAISPGGDFNPNQLRAATKKSKIVGDVVENYLKFAKGKLGLTFAASIECAREITEAYRAAGVPAEMITGKTDPLVRAELMRRFRNREIKNLVSVDILGEGVDIPAVEVVSLARPTQSFSLYMQQIGRALRPVDGKEFAYIIDHVDNFRRHGRPCAVREWTLDRRDRRAKSTMRVATLLRACDNPACLSVYDKYLDACIYCGKVRETQIRAAPDQVDGNLTEVDFEELEKLRKEIMRIDAPPRIPAGLAPHASRAVASTHWVRQEMQASLRSGMRLWAGYQRDLGLSDSEIYRLFYLTHGVDMLSAQTHNARDAVALDEKIVAYLRDRGIACEIAARDPAHAEGQKTACYETPFSGHPQRVKPERNELEQK